MNMMQYVIAAGKVQLTADIHRADGRDEFFITLIDL